MIDGFGVEVLSKADRRDVAAGAGAAVTAGAASSARYHAQGAKRLARVSQDENAKGARMLQVGQQRIVRHSLPAGTPGKLPLGPGHSNIAATHRQISRGITRQANAKELAQSSFKAARKAKGRAVVAVAAGAATAAVARRPRRAEPDSVSYR